MYGEHYFIGDILRQKWQTIFHCWHLSWYEFYKKTICNLWIFEMERWELSDNKDIDASCIVKHKLFENDIQSFINDKCVAFF